MRERMAGRAITVERIDGGGTETVLITREYGETSWVTAWWKRNRKLWGQLQQVRKGTRVVCVLCKGRPGKACGGTGCPLCGGERVIDRDYALRHLEMAHK